jgi:hypothetical protein
MFGFIGPFCTVGFLGLVSYLPKVHGFPFLFRLHGSHFIPKSVPCLSPLGAI